MKGWSARLMAYARTRWRGLALLAAMMFLAIGVDLLKPWPMKIICDDLLIPRSSPHKHARLAAWFLANQSPAVALAWLTAATVLLFLAGWGLQMLQTYLQADVGNRMTYDLAERVFDHVQRQSLQFHGRRRAGDLVRRILTDTGCVRDLVLWVLLPVLTSLLTVAAMIAILWQLDRWLTLIALAVAPLLLVLIRLFAGPLSEQTYRKNELEGAMTAMAEQTLTSLAVVKAFGREDNEDHRFRSLSRNMVRASMRATMSGLQFKAGTTAVTACGTAAVILVGGYHALAGSLSPGSLLVFMAYLAAMYSPMETLAYTSSQFASAAAGARRVFEVLDARESVVEKPDAIAVMSGRDAGHVRFEGVAFGYEPERPVLHDVSLEARPGELIALVGPTGAGKSTLISLVPRFFDPWRGRVTLGGTDIKDFRIAALRSKVSLVSQESFLLPLSIAENIAYGRPGATIGEIIAAAKAADAHRFITAIPQGYQTVLGERGATLSGGERQRIAIARALLKDAPILILDEPTSSLDSQTESSVLAALEKLMANRTTLVIAHRLSTVRRADKIIVLDQGRIVEQGSHDRLLSADGAYHKLHSLQFGGAADDEP